MAGGTVFMVMAFGRKLFLSLLCALLCSHAGAGRGRSQTVPTKLMKFSWYVEALRVSLTGTKGPCSSYSTKFYFLTPPNS